MKRATMTAAACLMAASLAACTGNQVNRFAPGVTVEHDEFGGGLFIEQTAVCAYRINRGDDNPQSLGFLWNEKTPGVVYVTAGVGGIENIERAEFMLEGGRVLAPDPAARLTDYGTYYEDGRGERMNICDDHSRRRFAMPWADFLALASSKRVTMRVGLIDFYSVSKFAPGVEVSDAGQTVNTRFGPFIEAVLAHSSGPK